MLPKNNDKKNNGFDKRKQYGLKLLNRLRNRSSINVPGTKVYDSESSSYTDTSDSQTDESSSSETESSEFLETDNKYSLEFPETDNKHWLEKVKDAENKTSSINIILDRIRELEDSLEKQLIFLDAYKEFDYKIRMGLMHVQTHMSQIEKKMQENKKDLKKYSDWVKDFQSELDKINKTLQTLDINFNGDIRKIDYQAVNRQLEEKKDHKKELEEKLEKLEKLYNNVPKKKYLHNKLCFIPESIYNRSIILSKISIAEQIRSLEPEITGLKAKLDFVNTKLAIERKKTKFIVILKENKSLLQKYSFVIERFSELFEEYKQNKKDIEQLDKKIKKTIEEYEDINNYYNHAVGLYNKQNQQINNNNNVIVKKMFYKNINN